jgi:GTP-binding protein
MQYLREVEKPLLIAVNKVDSERQAKDIYDFYELGIKRIFPISALHGHGIYELMEEVLCLIPIEKKQVSKDGQERILIKVAIVGRPNVGKSFLFNRLIGDERSVVSDMPGTTRDSIDTVLEYADKTYLFMDTAGLRRKSHIKTTLEKYSVKRALRTIEGTDIVLLLTEAPGGVTNQDLIILNYAKEYAKCILMVINKWDLMPKTPSFKKEYIESIKKRLNFARFLPIVTVSALKGQGVKQIFPLLNLLYQEYNQRISTGRLNRFMRDTLGKYPPPLYQNRPIKLYYITQINVKPPSFVVFTNYPQGVPKQYKRFLINQLAQLGFTHIPLRVFFRERRK